MNRIRKYGRIWHLTGSSDCLEPWAKSPEQLISHSVKKNSIRFVSKVRAGDGLDYFVKYEKKLQFPFFFTKAQREFRAFELLKSCGIPCVEYTAWSAGLHENIVVTKALPERFLQLIRIWYDSPEPSERLIHQICCLIRDLSQAGIFHPDFHMGNLMSDGKEIVLVDPPGVRKCAPTNTPSFRMLVPFTEVFGDFPDELIADSLNACGLYGTRGNALKALQILRQWREETLRKEWPRRCRQILSGTSKFATEIASGCFLRNSAWFAPVPEPPLSEVEKITLPAEEGKALWLDSFFDQLMKQKREKVPVRIEFSGEICQISLISSKKHTFFYGFR